MSLKSFIRLAAHTQLLPILESGEETLVGGQAVIEGVMMRAPHSYCVSVRKPNGEIVSEEHPLPRVSEKYPIFKVPVLRGIGTLGQAMYLGMKALKFSANAAVEELTKEGAGDAAKAASATNESGLTGGSACPTAVAEKTETAAKPDSEIPGWMMAANIALSVAFFIFFYKAVPLGLTYLLSKLYPGLHGRIAFNLLDGVIRIAMFVGFVYFISRWKEIHRVFEYHGAEHKVVFNFESGKPVTIENAQSFTTLHPRCGTSFLLVVMVLSTIVYMFIPVDTFLAKFLLRIALLLPVAGISYELIRFAAKRRSGLLAFLTAPGLWLQRITTQPPSDDQAEVAIDALQRAMKLEEEQGGELVIA